MNTTELKLELKQAEDGLMYARAKLHEAQEAFDQAQKVFGAQQHGVNTLRYLVQKAEGDNPANPIQQVISGEADAA